MIDVVKYRILGEQANMTHIGFWEELLHRKSDGIGMSLRYPRTARAAQRILDVLPFDLDKLDDATTARLAGGAIDKGVDLHGLTADILSEGPGKVIAKDALDRFAKHNGAEPLVTAVRAVLAPADLVIDFVRSRVFTAVSVAVTLGVYSASRSIQDDLHQKDARWHQDKGLGVAEGSGLHAWAGGPGRKAAPTVTEIEDAKLRLSIAKHNSFAREHLQIYRDLLAGNEPGGGPTALPRKKRHPFDAKPEVQGTDGPLQNLD